MRESYSVKSRSNKNHPPAAETIVPDAFVRKSITIPASLWDHVQKRVKDPLHANNLSSYIRTLIVHDTHPDEAKA